MEFMSLRVLAPAIHTFYGIPDLVADIGASSLIVMSVFHFQGATCIAYDLSQHFARDLLMITIHRDISSYGWTSTY